MKKICYNLLLFFSVFNLSVYGQGVPIIDKDSSHLILERTFYTVGFNKSINQATWTYYEIVNRNKVVNRQNNFVNDTIGYKILDYTNSGYDRGHLVPANDMRFSKVAMSESMLMTNIVPQKPSFNRGIWKKLETYISNLSINDTVTVFTGTYIVDSTLVNNKLIIPDLFFKIIYIPSKKYMIGFLIPHYVSKNEELKNFIVTVDYLEELININVFPNIENEDFLESKLEIIINF